MIGSTLHEDSVGDIVASALEGGTADVLIVNPARDAIDEVVEELRDLEEPRTVRILAGEGPLKAVSEDFLVASVVADLIESGTLEVREGDGLPNSSLLVSSEAVVSLVAGGSRVAGLQTDDESFVREANRHYDSLWEDAESFDLRTPPLSRIRETMESEIGEDTAADFDRVLDSLESVEGNGHGLGEVTISLLVAARNGELLYEISNWGEDVGLASKATFSRTKTDLEEEGLVDTEKVPIEIGRPRLRLVLGDERLEEADVDELAHVARRLLAT